MIIYLYKKTHRITGLKYLGKTIQDPVKYKGSGKVWLPHIKKHGNDVETEILKECSSVDELKKWGLYYSKLWNIVESSDWANLKDEEGDGISSTLAKKIANSRVNDGTNPFLGPNVNTKRILEKTHNLLGENNPSIKRVKEGTHHWCGPHLNNKRVQNGTHPWLDKQKHKERNEKLLLEGTHILLGKNGITQQCWTCTFCGKHGKGLGNYARWHKNNTCKGIK